MVYVAGMHRSGTSATARVVNLLGADLGDPASLMPAAHDNPRGFWEQTDVSNFNERLLCAFGGSWDYPPTMPPAWIALKSALPWLREADDLLTRIMGGESETCAVKDPRLSLTIPLWLRLTPAARTIISIRRPSAVARSLQRRNKMPMDHAYSLWTRYVTSVLDLVDDPIIIDYGLLVREPRRVAFTLARTLGLGDPPEDVVKRIETSIDSEMDHGGEDVSDWTMESKEASALYDKIIRGESFRRHNSGGASGWLAPSPNPRRARRVAVLHIGAEKTGTTAVQQTLAGGRRILSSAHILYPRSVGDMNHVKLAMYCMDEARRNDLTPVMPARFHSDREGWRRSVADDLSQEIVDSGASHVVISSEHLHSQLNAPREVARIRDLLEPTCDAFRIIFYLRRQDRAFVSRHSTYLRHGGTRGRVFAPDQGAQALYDYDRVLDLWASVFGEAAVFPRIYDNIPGCRRTIVEDFLLGAELPVDPVELPAVTRTNEALSEKGQLFLAQFNRMALRNMTDNNIRVVRRAVLRAVDELLPGPPFKPARADACAIFRLFDDSNARVARRWFARPHLFDSSFEEYPLEATEPENPNRDDVFKVMVAAMATLASS